MLTSVLAMSNPQVAAHTQRNESFKEFCQFITAGACIATPIFIAAKTIYYVVQKRKIDLWAVQCRRRLHLLVGTFLILGVTAPLTIPLCASLISYLYNESISNLRLVGDYFVSLSYHLFRRIL